MRTYKLTIAYDGDALSGMAEAGEYRSDDPGDPGKDSRGDAQKNRKSPGGFSGRGQRFREDGTPESMPEGRLPAWYCPGLRRKAFLRKR